MHVYGRPELWSQKGELRLRALSIERFGLGEHLAALERLKAKLAAEGLFAESRKRPLPRLPRRIGLVTGNDAAAKRDVLTAIQARFPPAQVLVAETLVQGRARQRRWSRRWRRAGGEPEVDVVVLARGGGSFEDLLPFSDERVVRAVAGCPVPIVSAVGHEQDTPLCDLAADVRASTPTAAGRLVVPDLDELLAGLDRARAGLGRGRAARRSSATSQRARPEHTSAAPRAGAARRAPARRARRSRGRLRALSPRATLERGYAIVRREGALVALGGGARGRRPDRRSRSVDGRFGAQRRVTFEEAEKELAQIVERLESGRRRLDEASRSGSAARSSTASARRSWTRHRARSRSSPGESTQPRPAG